MLPGPGAQLVAPGISRRARIMKHITRTALAVAGLALIGAAVLAGKDDIRKFRRMHSL
jgi:hypothetical protein